MDPWRFLKQIGLLVAVVCLIGSAVVFFSKLLGKTVLGWPTILAVIGALLMVSIFILWAISRSAYLPTADQVREVVDEIRSAHRTGVRSYKVRLHFCFPPHWRTYKVGKEGWVLRPKGLGVPVGFSIWSTAKELQFSDSSFQGMVKNVQDLAVHSGSRLHSDTLRPCKIAGSDGIEYRFTDLKRHESLGFFWCFGDDDYQLLIDASSQEHLQVIRPAIDEFIRSFEMR